MARELFEVIERGAATDDSQVRQVFSGRRFLSQLHVAKNYLVAMVLRSLRLFHGQHTIQGRLADSLRDIEILFKKELYDHCLNLIVRAENLAIRYERDVTTLEILGWKRKLLLARRSRGDVAAQLKTISAEEKRILERLTQLSELRTRALMIRPTDLGDASEFDVPGHMEQAPDTLAGITFHHHIRYVRAVVSGQPEKAREELRATIAACHARPHLVHEDPGPLTTALGNVVGLQLRQGQHQDAITTLAELRQVPTKFELPPNERTTIRLTARSFNIELELYRDTKNIERGLELMNEAVKYVEHHGGSIPEDYRVMLYYQFAHLQYHAADLSATMVWTNRLISDTNPAERNDLQFYARLLQLVAHAELDNLGVLKYAVASTRRYLKKSGKPTPYQSECMRFFTRLGSVPPHQAKKAYLDFAAKMKDKGLETDDTRDYFELVDWAVRRGGE